MTHDGLTFTPDPYYCSSTAVAANGKCPDGFNWDQILIPFGLFIIFTSLMIWLTLKITRKVMSNRKKRKEVKVVEDVGIVKGKHISLDSIKEEEKKEVE